MEHKTEHAAAMTPETRFEALAMILADWFIQKHGAKEREHSTGLLADTKCSCSTQRDFNGLLREGERP